MRTWSPMFFSLRTLTARHLALALVVAAALSPMVASAKNLGPVQGPNGLPWSLALDCTIGEPAWDVTVSTDGIYLRESDDRWVKLAAQPSSPKGSLRAWKLYHPDGRLGLLTLLNGPGNDGLSDSTYAYRFAIALGDVPLTGGCDRLPDGARPARVINVTDAQLLTVRETASATGGAVTSIGPGGYVWKKAAADKGSWVPILSSIPRESGPATIVGGWVNDLYLDRLR